MGQSEASNKMGKLEQGLQQALQAIDTQIAREMQRDPAALELQGVQKWEPYQKRVEHLTTFLMDSLGDNNIDLDGILVLSQALAKTLYFIVQDLSEEGLGKVRSQYCLEASKNILRDMQQLQNSLQNSESQVN